MQPTIAVDLAKNVFEIAVSRHRGKVAERHRLSRVRLLRFRRRSFTSPSSVSQQISLYFW